MQDIKKWINEKLIVDRFPVSNELKSGKHSKCNVVINVSDEYYLGNSEEIMKLGKLNYYFPMGESGESMGISSIYGALHVLYQIYQWNPEWEVLLHCQAGRNRSPTIKAAFYYMMTNEHLPNDIYSEDKLLSNNRLLRNCEDNYLPPLDKIELFLSKCKFAFDNPHSFLGGMYDWTMLESGLSNK